MGVGRATLNAFYVEGMRVEEGRLTFQVVGAKKDIQGNRQDFGTSYGPDVGFDLLQMRVKKTTAGYEATTTTWLAPLARPIDVVMLGGAIYVLEYSRPLDFKGDVPMLPGRLLELKGK